MMFWHIVGDNHQQQPVIINQQPVQPGVVTPVAPATTVSEGPSFGDYVVMVLVWGVILGVGVVCCVWLWGVYCRGRDLRYGR